VTREKSKIETGNWEIETGKWKLESGNWYLGFPHLPPATYHLPRNAIVLWQTSPELAKIDLTFQ
jgi:hypothetical protein